MNRLTKISFAVLLFLTTAGAMALQTFPSQRIELKQKSYVIELADTNARRTQGLMYRKQLARDAGMLFIYARPGDYRIWMKNTLIPLTVIWLDAQARIIEIKLLQPCRIENCPVYAAAVPSNYILELHPAEQGRFNIGDQLPLLPDSRVELR